jgi:dihydroorotase
MRLTGPDGRDPSVARRVRDEGIVIDLGHGSGGFSFETARRLADVGIWPDTISTDLHQLSMKGPMFDLPTSMTKLLAIGMPLGAVVDAVTRVPARILGVEDELGRLSVGAVADVAVLIREPIEARLADVHFETIAATERLRCLHTIVGGRLAPRIAPEHPAPWIAVTERQRAVYASATPGTILPDAIGVDDLGPPLVTDRDPSDILAEADRAFGLGS